MHLGGQDGITAYHMEDNEMWMRLGATAASQVTVAVRQVLATRQRQQVVAGSNLAVCCWCHQMLP
jgi:hypothetical protein